MAESVDGSAWRKSTFSGGDGCVEVSSRADGSVEVRDSKDPSGPRLAFSKTEWSAFKAGVLAGQF